jgi:hypothetical protein
MCVDGSWCYWVMVRLSQSESDACHELGLAPPSSCGSTFSTLFVITCMCSFVSCARHRGDANDVDDATGLGW